MASITKPSCKAILEDPDIPYSEIYSVLSVLSGCMPAKLEGWFMQQLMPRRLRMLNQRHASVYSSTAKVPCLTGVRRSASFGSPVLDFGVGISQEHPYLLIIDAIV